MTASGRCTWCVIFLVCHCLLSLPGWAASLLDSCPCSPPAHPLLMCLLLGGCAQKFIRQQGIPVETALRVYKRYLKYEPTHVEEYIAYLKAKVGA